jgi:hypothetical protein
MMVEKKIQEQQQGEPEEGPALPSPVETQRRVYALPQEMVERIVQFQKEKGFPSEVEAVRRLLDDALKSRDDLERIVNRFLGKLKHLRIASEVAKDVLVGHPLVASMSFSHNGVSYRLKDGWSVSISDTGFVSVRDDKNKVWEWKHPKGDRFAPGGLLDDEIPF